MKKIEIRKGKYITLYSRQDALRNACRLARYTEDVLRRVVDPVMEMIGDRYLDVIAVILYLGLIILSVIFYMQYLR